MGACRELTPLNSRLIAQRFLRLTVIWQRWIHSHTGHWNTMVQKYLSPSYNISWCISARNILFQKYIRLFQIILRLVLR